MYKSYFGLLSVLVMSDGNSYSNGNAVAFGISSAVVSTFYCQC